MEFLIGVPRNYYMNTKNFYLVDFHDIDILEALQYNILRNSTCCVFYYNESYVPVLKGNRAVEDSRKSGIKIAYEYAKKKKKEIINLFR